MILLQSEQSEKTMSGLIKNKVIGVRSQLLTIDNIDFVNKGIERDGSVVNEVKS